MKFIKIALIVVIAAGVTALGIDAADTLRGSDGTLLSQLVTAVPQGDCPAGMTVVVGLPEKRCIDIFEASAGSECPARNPGSIIESTENVNDADCRAASVPEASPWRNVTRSQAETACARAGKRLPTNEEWYRAALGTPDGPRTPCNVDSGALRDTRNDGECVSASGAFDMVGNVWEWIGEDVEGNTFRDITLPDSGFISSVDSAGIPRTATTTESIEFNADYVWTSDDGVLHGLIRGGFYDSNTDAGVYTFHAGTLPTTPGVAIGFRCVL